MPAGKYDFIIEKKADFTRTITYYQDDGETPVNLTGFSAQAQIKESFKDTSAIFSFSVSIPTPATGEIIIATTKENIALLESTKPNGNVDWYYWDMILTHPDTFEERLLEGKVRVSDGVTDWA